MAGKIPDVSNRLNSIDGRLGKIEGLLKESDKKKNQSLWISFAIVSIPMMLVGITLVAQSLALTLITGITGYIIFFLGLAVAFTGVYMVLKVSCCNSTIAKKDKKLEQQDKKMNLSLWLILVAPIGFSVFLAGWVGVIESWIAKNSATSLCTFFIVMGIGLVVYLIGIMQAIGYKSWIAKK
ncbi:MAG: hypothetical protein WCA51_00060 [Dehalococcoidia bacterium]